MQTHLRWLAALAAAAALVACTDAGGSRGDAERSTPGHVSSPGQSPTIAPVRGGRVRLGFVGAPATLDPYSPLASDLTYALARPVYPSLYELDPDGVPRRSLATHLEHTTQGVVVRLKRTRWSDGSTVGANDVIASIRRARAPSGFARVTAARRISVREVSLRGHVGDWRQALATLAFVLPNGVVEGGKRAIVGGGPFRIASYTPGLRVLYKPNRDGRLTDPPLVEEVVVEFVESEDVLLQLLDDGRLDAAVPPATVNLAERLDDLDVESDAKLGWESVRLVLERSLSRSERAAVVAAVDRGALVTGFVRDDGRVSNTLHPSPESAGGRWRGSLGKKMRVPTPVKLLAPTGDELLTLMQRALQIQLIESHVKVEPITSSAADFYGRWRLDDPADVAIVRAAGAPGLAEGRAALRNLTALPIAQVRTYLAWRRAVHGLSVNPTFAGPLWNAESWWREPR